MGEEQAKPFDLPPGPRRSHGEGNEGGSCPDHGDELFAAHQPGDDEAASAREGEGVVHCTHANHQAITVFPLAAAQQAAAAHKQSWQVWPRLVEIAAGPIPPHLFLVRVGLHNSPVCSVGCDAFNVSVGVPLAALSRLVVGFRRACASDVRMCGDHICGRSAGSVDITARFDKDLALVSKDDGVHRQTAAGAVFSLRLHCHHQDQPRSGYLHFHPPPPSLSMSPQMTLISGPKGDCCRHSTYAYHHATC